VTSPLLGGVLATRGMYKSSVTLLINGSHHGSTSTRTGLQPLLDDVIAITAIVVTGSVLVKRASHWARTHDEGPRDLIEIKTRQISSAASAAADAWRKAGEPGTSVSPEHLSPSPSA
jgi:hypothetical protein